MTFNVFSEEKKKKKGNFRWFSGDSLARIMVDYKIV